MHVADHHTAAELRQFIRRERRAAIVRRLQTILGALAGETSKALAPRVQLSERSVRDWVSRYNREGRAGLEDRPGRGRKKALTDAQERQLQDRVRAGATESDGVCTLRGEDVRRILAEEFGVVRKLPATYNLLHKLGFTVLRPRPQHPDADPAAQEAFKKKRLRSSPKSPPGTPTNRSKSGSRTRPASARRAR
jgi:transposase